MGSVYLINVQASDKYKIGYTARPIHKRLQELRSKSPDHLELVAVKDAEPWEEARLHQMFRRQRLNGEWYEFPCLDTTLCKFLRQSTKLKAHQKLPTNGIKGSGVKNGGSSNALYNSAADSL